MYMSERHQEGLAHLLYGINMGGGFVALTGEVGTGKTTLCRCLLQQLPDNIDLALILNPKLNAIELLTTLCDELGIAYDHQQQSLKQCVDTINQYLLDAYAKGRRTVLLIDEAQNLSMEVLEQVRLLTNLETSKAKLLQIVLVGQPELQQLLNRRDLRQLNQRITARYHLLPLSLTETRAYIQHRLMVCQGNPALFKESAIKKVFHYSKGIPRLINILCDRALLGAYASNSPVVSPAIIDHAARETLGLGVVRRWFTPLVLVSIGLILAAGVYALSQLGFLKLQNASPVVSVLKPAELAVANHQQAPVPPKSEPMTTTVVKPVINPEPITQAKSATTFNLDQHSLSLDAALTQTLKVWHKNLPADKFVDCAYLKTLSLNCLVDKASWRELLELDRPVILVLEPNSTEKRYVLMTGVEQGQLVIGTDYPTTLSMVELLKVWNGGFLMVWQSPRADMIRISPNKNSEDVLWLRKQLAKYDRPLETAQPSLFDQELKKQLIAFQQQHRLVADGVAGARTLILLDNLTGARQSPHLKVKD